MHERARRYRTELKRRRRVVEFVGWMIRGLMTVAALSALLVIIGATK